VVSEEWRAARSAAWGAAAAVLGVGAFAIWQVAVAPGSSFPILPAYGVGLAAAALYMCFATVWGWWPAAGSAAVASTTAIELPAVDQADDVALVEATNPTDPATTDRWRLTINDVGSEVLQLQNNGMSHRGYARRSSQENPPPSFRIGMSVACSPLDPATPTTSEVRARFLSFLGRSPAMDLIRELTTVGDGLT
jgi:hypothetical protein